MAAAIGLKGTKILRFRHTTLRIQLSVPKGTQTAQRPQVFATLKKAPKDWWSLVIAIVRVLYETEIVRRKVHSNGW